MLRKPPPRKNVTVRRDESGDYILRGTSEGVVAKFTAHEWRNLGLRPLSRGVVCVVDLQVSGIAKKRR